MADPESPEQLPGDLPSVGALQFRRAQPVVTTETPAGQSCAACKQLISGPYFQVQNHVICASCAARIQAGKQQQKPVPMLRPVIYGLGAALAGCILYAIPLAIGFQIGIVALLVGWMVGKAIRNASYGVGGRPQQILAVALTYFAISTSIIPAVVFMGMKQAYVAHSTGQKPPVAKEPPVQDANGRKPRGATIGGFIALATISPFLGLASSPVGGLISLFILFIGLQRAWALTARHEIMVTGPYS